MRNLALLSQTNVDFDEFIGVKPGAKITTTAIDLDENVVYAAAECAREGSGEVSVDVFKIVDGHAVPLVPFTTLAYGEFEGRAVQEIVLMRFMPETRKLGLFMRGGDIVTINVDAEDLEEPDIEGTVEPGILAASWNPDDSILVLITAAHKMMLMTTSFDTLSEAPLHTSDPGEDLPINVGWGSKQTQFHGSLGKQAAQAPTATIVGASPDDDRLPRVSWRGDGSYFVVSSLTSEGSANLRRRILRVYDREGRLQNTAEDVGGLECSVAWRPSGNLITGTQRFGGFEGAGVGREGRHDVVFFERNGLRHGEFSLFVGKDATGKPIEGADQRRRWGYRVRELSWSADSTVLGIWVEHEQGDVVQLWTIGNYHWYLKQEIWARPSKEGEVGRFTSFSWHPEQSLVLQLTTDDALLTRVYTLETFNSLSNPPNDSGSVAVFDGGRVLITPFRTQNIPPPMSSAQLDLFSNPSKVARTQPWRAPTHASFSPSKDLLSILWENGDLQIFDLHTRLGPGAGKAVDPALIFKTNIFEEATGWSGANSRQVEWSFGGEGLAVLVRDGDADRILVVKGVVSEPLKAQVEFVELSQINGRLVAGSHAAPAWEGPDGSIHLYNHANKIFEPSAKFPEFCPQAQMVAVPNTNTPEALYVGLSPRGKLHAASAGLSHELAGNATSFTIAPGFVIFTTSAHEAVFAPVSGVSGILAAQRPESVINANAASVVANTAPTGREWEKRRVERGSRIVVAVPSAMTLVLQMPRGNLETVAPRPLVIEVVKQDLDAGNYRKAFMACRKHRIDLNVLVTHNEDKFLREVDRVLEQINEIDHINLLLTNIGRGSQPQETISNLCDAIRVELERINLTKYVNSVLTAYVVKTPPEYEGALKVLHLLKESDPKAVEEAVKYVIFLADADKLFDVALGMYDFSLVLMIAQYAQKDPREYLPFLRELRALDKYYQRFKIDDHLKKTESALRNLSLAGDERFEEATAYIEMHQLYEVALKIWKDTGRYETILDLYGDWLYERRDFRQAAVVFSEAKKWEKAMIAHEKALEWQEMFCIAMDVGVEDEEVEAMAYRIADDLISKKRFAEAARLFLDYAKNARQAVVALSEGSLFSEARRIIKINAQPELLEEIVYPAALESRAQINEDLKEMQEQLEKQRNRLVELRIKKVEEPDAYYGADDPTLHNVDVMTDTSMPATMFTRYTVAPTAASRSSKRSSRSKRKMERKVGSGKKGTVDEEEYLLKSITKLAARFTTTREETRKLLPHLFQFTPSHRLEGVSLQAQISKFEAYLDEVIAEVWRRPNEEGDEGEQKEDTWQSRMEEVEKKKNTNPLDKVTKPEFGVRKDWGIDLLRPNLG